MSLVFRVERRQRGIALILVLWVLVLLTVIAFGFAFSARTESVLAGHLVSLSRAQALADGGIQRGLYEFLRPVADRDTGWKADGRTYEIELDGSTIQISVLDETSYIDLNYASDVLLRGLFISVGVPDVEADHLVDAIIDWRDADDLVHANGAERDQYEAAGMGYIPANANFQSVDELARVIGMTRDTFNKVRHALTVYSNQPGFNSTNAPRQVLLAVPGAIPEEVDAYLEQREALRTENQAVPPFPPANAYMAGSGWGGGVYNFKALAKLSDGISFGREAVARLERQPQHPYSLLNWKEITP